ncbi:sensor histidine kinase [Parachitinimonas caeni]|uniref:histidine kinase n=1 Tax=Parachitinimonas caeni TaxID=3031301 RepID=A0ABT7E375_9NEIS|nr:sensor histidine kinase [Parachitinimonas caeni]MDK2125367.1 sensor histidine kinase N-terminal domain-containing protein [Parachitinimonas caeni]
MPQRFSWPLRLGRQLSLKRQLLLWLLAPQLLLWLAAAFVTFGVALRYTNLAIDQSLAQSSRALARQVKPLDDGLLIDFPTAARDILEEDPEDKLYYMVSTPPGRFILGNRDLPAFPPQDKIELRQPYFYDGVLNQQPVRIAALYLMIGTDAKPQLMLVQVAKSNSARTELAKQILFATVIPLSALMLATSLIVWAGISRGLSPLRLLRRQVENRTARDLTPLEIENAPTEVRALASAINTLLGEVNRNVAAQRRFIADAAHQLRTPLAGLKSQTELALRELDNPNFDARALHARLENVETSTRRSIHLVNQLLALARAEPDAPINRAPLDLSRLARDITAEAVPRALAAGLDLGLADDYPPLLVSGNEALLRELVANLIDNAIQYTPSGGHVTVRLIDQADTLTLQVEDNGPGIADVDKERVFERFYRVQTSGKGCGLGLAIVKEIARRHGASLTLSDAQPHGLIISLHFDLRADP